MNHIAQDNIRAAHKLLQRAIGGEDIHPGLLPDELEELIDPAHPITAQRMAALQREHQLLLNETARQTRVLALWNAVQRLYSPAELHRLRVMAYTEVHGLYPAHPSYGEGTAAAQLHLTAITLFEALQSARAAGLLVRGPFSGSYRPYQLTAKGKQVLAHSRPAEPRGADHSLLSRWPAPQYHAGNLSEMAEAHDGLYHEVYRLQDDAKTAGQMLDVLQRYWEKHATPSGQGGMLFSA